MGSGGDSDLEVVEDMPCQTAAEDVQQIQEEEEGVEGRAYEKFKEMILAFADETQENRDPMLLDYTAIRPQRLGGVHTIKTFKHYKPIIQNSRISTNFNIFPFGFNPENSS
jgi:hypothetical protein